MAGARPAAVAPPPGRRSRGEKGAAQSGAPSAATDRHGGGNGGHVCEQRSPVDFLSADRDRGRRRRGGAFRSAGARPYGETAAPRKYGNNSPPRRCPRNRLIWRGDRFNDVCLRWGYVDRDLGSRS